MPIRTTLILACLLALTSVAQAQTIHTEYTGTDEIFRNPERGFHSLQSSQAEMGALSRTRLQQLKDDGMSLILRLYYLKKFKESPMSDFQLELIQKDMDLLREMGMKATLRFAYSSNENEADAPLQTILTHLDQLEPILRQNVDVIASVEAGFIGAWGEWYYSSNNLNNTESRREVMQKWLSVLPTQRMVQIRTPGYKKAIFGRSSPLTREEAHSGSDFARASHHNDCFLASDSDYGTYSNPADKVFLREDSKYTNMGGETCNPYPPRSECASAIAEMEAMHWSYLNQDYHRTVLQSWETGGCMDEVKRRLGYRFRLLSSDVPSTVKPGDSFPVSISLTNDGFAAPYNPRRVEIVLREQASGARYVVLLDDDPRFWLPGETIEVAATVGVPADLPEGEYEVLFNLPAPERSIYDRADYAIRLANEQVWEPETGYNHLLVTTSVSADASGEVYDGNAWFRPYEQHVSAERPGPATGWSVSPVYPNPFSDRAALTIRVPSTQSVSVRVIDMLGRSVATLHDGILAANSTHEFSFDSTGWPGGLFMLAVQGMDFRATRSAIHLP